jgi:hypothetical protein
MMGFPLFSTSLVLVETCNLCAPDAAVVAGSFADAASLNECLVQTFWPYTKGRFGGVQKAQTRRSGFQIGNHSTPLVIKMSRKMIKTVIS